MNKAVVNESVQDKMIRELKAENDKLKELLKAANMDENDLAKLRSGLGFSGNAKDLAEQMAENERKIQERERDWEERLKEQREKDRLEHEKQLELKQLMDRKAPHLTNLNEDIQLSGKMYYSLAHCLDGKILYIGRNEGNPKPQIILRGVGI